MNDPYRYPKLRWPLELKIERFSEKEAILIRDPAGISDSPLLLIPQVAPLISSFEGTLSVEEIAEKFKPMGATPEIVAELAGLLNRHHFLVTPEFLSRESTIKNDFLSLESRPAALAGLSYSSDTGELAQAIDQMLRAGEQTKSRLSQQKKEMVGLISPHIDYQRGGTCYGIAYNNLKENNAAIQIVIGTSHQYSPRLFHLTKKHFDSPLGRVFCAQDMVEQVAQLHGTERSFADEMLHRKEHSLELQIPFLKRVLSGDTDSKDGGTTIVPILVGSFYEMLLKGSYPEENEEYLSFISALTESVKDRLNRGIKVSVIAAVDMAHIGQTFGDKGKLSPEKMKEVEERDMLYIESIKQQNKKVLYNHIAEDLDSRRICGFPTIYTVIDLFERLRIRYQAELFDYRQAVDYGRECAVTFAGIGLYQQIEN